MFDIAQSRKKNDALQRTSINKLSDFLYLSSTPAAGRALMLSVHAYLRKYPQDITCVSLQIL